MLHVAPSPRSQGCLLPPCLCCSPLTLLTAVDVSRRACVCVCVLLLSAAVGTLVHSLRYSAMNPGPGGATVSSVTLPYGSLDDGDDLPPDEEDYSVFPYSSIAHDAATSVQRMWKRYMQRKRRAATLLQVARVLAAPLGVGCD